MQMKIMANLLFAQFMGVCWAAARFIDSRFESWYLCYVKIQSFIVHYQASFNAMSSSTIKSMQILFATLLILYGQYFAFFVNLFCAYIAVKV